MRTDEDTWITDDVCEERGRWMQTYTGQKFFPLDPKPEEINIEDIAHALSQMCRFSGHTSTFYSVAQHSILCSRLAGCEEVAFAALLHDAAEAYVGDMIRPLKWNGERLGLLFCQLEDTIVHVISERFAIEWTPAMKAEVKRLDDVALGIEAYYLMGNTAWVRELHGSLLALTPEFAGLLYAYEPWVKQTPMSMAKHYFLARFDELQVRG